TLFGETKMRGLNLEDTRLKSPARLDLLLAIVAIAVAWANRTAAALVERGTLPRKNHGHDAKSWFRNGFHELRRALRTDPAAALNSWPKTLKTPGVVSCAFGASH
ncbi:MAG TPA: hypothetical protein VGC31_09025, partial [Paenirhodobacter sp.]